MEDGRKPKPVTVLNRFGDVVNLNSFVVSNPEYALVKYKTSRLAGLWMLELEVEDGKNKWTIGYNIHGFGDTTLRYSIDVVRRGRGYVDADQEYVILQKNSNIFVMLPNEGKEEVVFTAPLICRRCNMALMEPVYIWRDIIGWYHILDCRNGTYLFESLDELETWLHETKDGRKLPWGEWYVVGVVADDEWVDAVKRAVPGELGPTPHEVIELVRRLTE